MSLQLAMLQVKNKRSFQLTEEDVLRACQAVLPVAKVMISTAHMYLNQSLLC